MNSDLNITKVEVYKSENGYFINYEEKYFKVSKLIYDMFFLKLRGDDFAKISDYITLNYHIDCSQGEVEEIYLTKLNELMNINHEFTISSSIYLKIILIREHFLGHIVNLLKFLIFKKNILVLTLTSLLIIIFTLLVEKEIFFQRNFNLGWEFIVTLYLSIFIIGVIHELGHATASAFYGVKPKSIGFGFFLIFPVLYADISQVWMLSKYKRVIVNLSGIYFQAIITALICVLIIIIDDKLIEYFLINAVYSSALMMLISINPFFKNDGYWIYSDYFDIQNLNQKSKNYIKNILKNRSNKINKPLLIYSILNTVVLSIFYVALIPLSYKSFQTILKLLYDFRSVNFKDILLLIVFTIFIYRLFTYIKQTYFKWKMKP